MTFTRALVLALGLAWCALPAGPAHAQSPQRVGVVVGTAVNVEPAEADEIASALGHALEEALGVVVTAGAEARRRLPLDGLPEGCASEPACRRDLGQRLDADEILFLVIVRVGTRIQIDSTWTELESGKLASRPAIVIDEGDDRAEVFAESARALLPHITPPRRPAPVGDTTGESIRARAGDWPASTSILFGKSRVRE